MICYVFLKQILFVTEKVAKKLTMPPSQLHGGEKYRDYMGGEKYTEGLLQPLRGHQEILQIV